MTCDPVLSVDKIHKSYGSTRALSDVAFSVGRGDVVGFLGPNGAGKTTLMKIIMGLERADAGGVSLLGIRDGAAKKEVRRRIGYLQEKPPIYPEMTARAYLAFFARMYRVAQPDERVAHVLKRVELSGAADRRLGGFSRGMQQRACLARVMLHDPEFLLLDEPTLGLDPAGVAQMRRFFLEMQAEGTTLMFSSHQLSEMERICSRLIFISHGRIIAHGTTRELLPLASAGDLLTVEIAQPAEQAAKALAADDGVARAERLGERLVGVRLKNADELSLHQARTQLSRLVTESGFTVLAVTRERPGLEDLFLKLTDERTAELQAA